MIRPRRIRGYQPESPQHHDDFSQAISPRHSMLTDRSMSPTRRPKPQITLIASFLNPLAFNERRAGYIISGMHKRWHESTNCRRAGATFVDAARPRGDHIAPRPRYVLAPPKCGQACTSRPRDSLIPYLAGDFGAICCIHSLDFMPLMRRGLLAPPSSALWPGARLQPMRCSPTFIKAGCRLKISLCVAAWPAESPPNARSTFDSTRKPVAARQNVDAFTISASCRTNRLDEIKAYLHRLGGSARPAPST